MFSSLTPYFFNSVTQPSTRAEMIFSFQRAWTMPMRRPEPEDLVRKKVRAVVWMECSG